MRAVRKDRQTESLLQASCAGSFAKEGKKLGYGTGSRGEGIDRNAGQCILQHTRHRHFPGREGKECFAGDGTAVPGGEDDSSDTETKRSAVVHHYELPSYGYEVACI